MPGMGPPSPKSHAYCNSAENRRRKAAAVSNFVDVVQKPDNASLQKLIAPVGAQLQAATELSEGRRSAAFNHLKAVAEALQALSWVVYSGPNSGAHMYQTLHGSAYQSAGLKRQHRKAILVGELKAWKMPHTTPQ